MGGCAYAYIGLFLYLGYSDIDGLIYSLLASEGFRQICFFVSCAGYVGQTLISAGQTHG